jgi:hypothetical protein
MLIQSCTTNSAPYHLYWSDGEYSLSTQADADPVDLVDMARRLYCEP